MLIGEAGAGAGTVLTGQFSTSGHKKSTHLFVSAKKWLPQR